MFAGASLDENSGAFCELKANFFRLILTKAELLALTYNDINLEEKTISINKSYQRLKGKDMITQPKTPKSIRVITMPDFLAEEFREYCSHLYGIMKKERLFRFTKSHMEHCMARADAGCNMFDKDISTDQWGSCAYTSGQEPFAQSRV